MQIWTDGDCTPGSQTARDAFGGQQQIVAIAGLANDPPIIAADEPTGNLDVQTADEVFQLFERLLITVKLFNGYPRQRACPSYLAHDCFGRWADCR